MAFECPRRSSPPSPMFDADTGCIATDPAPSARRRFRSKTGIENLPANEHAQETPHTPSPTRTTRRIQSGCAGSRPRLRDGMPGSPSQHIDITRAKWIPYFDDIPPIDLQDMLRFLRSLPDPRLYECIRDGELEGRLRVYRTPTVLVRRFDRLAALPGGYIPVGDVVAHLNPLGGQGMSVAAVHADILRKHLEMRAEKRTGPEEFSQAFVEEAVAVSAKRPTRN